jgi:hypothetical protein
MNAVEKEIHVLVSAPNWPSQAFARAPRMSNTVLDAVEYLGVYA